ncbi:DEAD/DEAH box helicase [Geoglobus acetivorans]|uniref:DEAD/DEAH box helicase n=1 Tax=Geoglobus acetivorans TaxID=565033 RepID=A0ABZ3H534_GEOAI|nr:DEAD/DEAH box helicase [Geoglobus acetivorans]
MNSRLKEVLEKLGIRELNELQRMSYSEITGGKNCLIIAPTGSGKTEAAVIPLIEKIYEENLPGMALLYITPLRALNRDMLRRIEQIARELGISIAVRHGDTGEGERRRQSLKPPQILITTPETFQLLFLGKNLRKALKNVKFVVLDEVHEFADSERGVQLSVALERLREYSDFQTVALSATVGDRETIAEYFGCEEVIEFYGQKRYEFSVVKAEACGAGELPEADASFSAELMKIKEISENHRSTLIFVNTRQTAEALALHLKKVMDVEVHHGSLSKDVRIENERKFMEGEVRALICTSSLELGIDIGHVDCVIQYNSPREVKRLIQRVGRAGHRLEKVSKGYIIANTFDDLLESIVIVRRAEERKVEKTDVHESSLDTLANQISAIALEYGTIEEVKLYRIITRAYPFRNLDYEFFIQFLNFLAGMGLVFYGDGVVRARRRTRRYFYDNISMIPDERHYPVKEITTGRIIGVLDESFLQTFSGELFAMKGEVWRVISVDEFVRVLPAGVDAEVPSWTGEEIPVPYEVAQDVGRVRRIIGDLLMGEGEESAVKYLMENYRINEDGARYVVGIIKEHVEKGFKLPTDSRLVIECSDDATILNACFGHKVNEGLGRVLALLISNRKGRNIGVEIDPYRIRLIPATCEDVLNALEYLRNLNRDELVKLLELSLADTRLFHWKIINVARKTGYLSKDVEMNRVNVKKLVQRLYETPIFREAMREILVEKIDFEKIYDILANFDDFEVVTYHTITPVGSASSKQSFDVLFTSKPIRAVIETFRKRIENENCHFHCLNCGYTITLKVRMIDSLQCPRCKSRMVAVVSGRRDLSKIDRGELYRIANLVMVHGMKAVYALNTYGIGVETATRILLNFYPDEESFLKALLEAEKNYIKSRAFWD